MKAMVVGLVGTLPARAGLAAAIEAAGAAVEVCTSATALTLAAELDAIVFDVTDDPDSFLPTAQALRDDPRTRVLPRLVLVPSGTTVAWLTPFGPSLVLPHDAPTALIAAAVTETVERAKAREIADQDPRSDDFTRRAAQRPILDFQEDAATLSHDARVLLGLVVGYASNLRDGLAGPVNELQRVHAANIVEAATNTTSLVERHVEAVRAAFRAKPSEPPLVRSASGRRLVDVADVVRSTVALFEGIASGKNVRLVANAGVPVPSWCDPMQIKQALVNLVSNAMKFTPAGGTVAVTVAFAGPEGGRRNVEIIVRDSGPGIPIEQRDRVFERGVRLDRDRASIGSGIGLSVVRSVVEMHGGTVGIDEAEGGGAQFVVTIPVDRRARASGQHRASRADVE